MMKSLKLQKFRFELISDEERTASSFPETTIRGALGYTFKRLLCCRKDKNCSNCFLNTKCVYSYLFETPLPPGSPFMRLYKSVPHPYVLMCEQKNGGINIDLTLIGNGIDYLPYFILVFDEIAKAGIGKNRILHRLMSVKAEPSGKIIFSEGAEIIDKSFEALSLPISDGEENGIRRIRITLITPLRYKVEGSYGSGVSIRSFISTLMRRISALSTFHGEGYPELDYKSIVERADSLECENVNVKWSERERFSTRQKDWMKIGGITGSFDIAGDSGFLIPYLRIGENVHNGKGTSFGCGKYIMEVL